MKIEIDDKEMIKEIVRQVVERLKPLLNNSHNSKGDELMDVKGLADYLKVKESWIYEKIHTRQIPFRKIGKFPRFLKKHIDLWALNQYHPDLSIYKLNHKVDELMDVKGLADYLKVKASWIYEKIHTKEIPFKKIGKFPRFRRKDIDLWWTNPYHPDLSIYNLNLNGRG